VLLYYNGHPLRDRVLNGGVEVPSGGDDLVRVTVPQPGQTRHLITVHPSHTQKIKVHPSIVAYSVIYTILRQWEYLYSTI
jgi:hypothetical protein